MKVENARRPDHRVRYAYTLTPEGGAERARLTGRFLLPKIRAYEALEAEIAALLDARSVDARGEGRRHGDLKSKILRCRAFKSGK